MAKRHAVVLEAPNLPRWRLGVWQIFDPWVDPHLQLLQGHTVPKITRPLTIEFHFRRVVHRLVRSLERLHDGIRKWDAFLEAGGLASAQPELAFDIPETGGIAADSVVHYLNLFIDDLARVIPFIVAPDGTEPKEPDGFGSLKRMVSDGEIPASSALCGLFANLDGDDSWWCQGFRRGTGIRQRLTHYTDLVYFRGTTRPGDARMTGAISLISVGGPVHLTDFERALRDLLGKLCDWLEELDQELLRHLSKTLAARGVAWDPFSRGCPAVTMPRREDALLDASHYFYLPVSKDA